MVDLTVLNDEPSINPAAFQAVIEVETSGKGFIDDKPKILVEGHIAYRLYKASGKNPEPLVGHYVYPKWTKAYYKGGIGEYQRLEALIDLVGKEIAYKSTSWGIGQILGSNHKLCGYDDVFSFVEAMYKDEETQLKAMIEFMRSSNLLRYIETDTPNWAAFARGYNGNQYKKNQYDLKLARAYRKFTTSPQEDFKPITQSTRVQASVVAGVVPAVEVIKEVKTVITEGNSLIDVITSDSVIGSLIVLIALAFIIYSWFRDRKAGGSY